MATTIDDFGDGDISEYSGDTGSSFVSGGVLEIDAGSGNNANIQSTSGLNYYPSAGDTWEVDVYLPSSSHLFSVIFYSQSEDSNLSNAYRIEYYGGTGNYTLFRENSNILERTTENLSGWMTLTISTQSDGYIEVSNTDTSTVLSGTDATYTGGGIGFRGGLGNNVQFDNAQTVPQPPSAPSNLSATQGNENQIDLSWTDNSNNEDGFYIYRTQTSGSGYSQIDSVGVNTTTYTDTSLEDGEQYFYEVSAYNTSGESGRSNEDGAVTVLPAPSNVSATNV